MGSRCLSTAAFVKEIDSFNPLNAKWNPICHLLALLGAHHILHVSRIRVNGVACNPHHGKVLLCWLSRTIKHLEHWQSAVSKIKCTPCWHIAFCLCIHSIRTSHLVMRIQK
jgi:hypothetical protein